MSLNDQISNLMLQKGRAEAGGVARSGQAWGSALSQIGQQVGQAIGDVSKYRSDVKAAEQAKAQDQQFLSIMTTGQTPDPAQVIQIYGPERGGKILQGLVAFHELNTGAIKDARDTSGRLAMGVKSLSPEMQQQFWPQIRETAIKGGLGTAESIPEQVTPEYLETVIAWSSGKEPAKPEAKKTREIRTRNADGSETVKIVEDAPGFEAKSEPVPVPPVKVTYGAPTPVMIGGKRTLVRSGSDGLTYDMQGKQLDASSAGPDVPPTQGPAPQFEWVTRDGNTIQVRKDDVRKGDIPYTAMSAQERMDARKFDKAEPVIKSIEELSERINTTQGLIATMRGGAEKLAAKANYDDDVAEYQALVSGFTPLVARSLGHTGVLTQQDVDSVKELFPKPQDSKTLRNRKVTRIRSIMKDIKGGDEAKETDTGGIRSKAAAVLLQAGHANDEASVDLFLKNNPSFK